MEPGLAHLRLERCSLVACGCSVLAKPSLACQQPLKPWHACCRAIKKVAGIIAEWDGQIKAGKELKDVVGVGKGSVAKVGARQHPPSLAESACPRLERVLAQGPPRLAYLARQAAVRACCRPAGAARGSRAPCCHSWGTCMSHGMPGLPAHDPYTLLCQGVHCPHQCQRWRAE